MDWPLLRRPRIVAPVEQSLASRPFGAAMLTGASGMGKSTVASQVADAWQGRGGEVLTLVGLAELAEVPLAAFAPHAGRLGLDPATWTAQSLMTAAGSLTPAPLLLVDDAPLLDPTSAAVVYQLVRVYGVRAVLTGRTEHLAGGPIERLLHERVATQVEVGGFDFYEIRLLLRRRYDAAPRPDDVARLLRQTQGNPMLLREVLLRTERRGLVARVDSGIELEPIEVPTDVRRSMRDRVADLADADRELIALATLADGAPIADLLTPEQRRRAERLVDESLLHWMSSGTLRPAHPLLGEATLTTLTHEERDAFAERVARGLESGDGDAARFVAVRLRCHGGGATDEDVEWAIGHAYARGEYLEAVQLDALHAEHRPGWEPSTAAQLYRASSLSWLGRIAEADAVFTAVDQRVSEPAERALVVSRYGAHLVQRRFEVAGALRLAAAHDPYLGEAERAALAPEIRSWQLLAGRTVALPTQGSWGEDVDPALEVRAAIASIVVGAMGGHDTAAEAQLLTRIQRRHGVLEPHAADLVHLQRYFALLAQGRGAEAEQVVVERRTGCAADAAGLWTYLLARHLALRGRLEQASTLAGFAVELLTWRDPVGFLGAARALRPLLAASAGEIDTAEQLLAALPAEHASDPKVAVVTATVEGLALASRGDRDGAARVICDAARHAIDVDHGLLAALALGECLRLGVVDEAADLLGELRTGSAGLGLYDGLDEAAETLGSRDPSGALRAAGMLHGAGLDVVAVDTLAWAETMAPSTSEVRRKLHRLRLGIEQTSEARPLAGGPTARAGDLTDREQEIVDLVRARLSNREVAQQLGISASTVDNHLTSAYRKLGVSGRSGLRQLLAEPSDELGQKG
ncbi:AAA family ATPase [Nocardioides sp. BGMRC 2183]|nr:AAA family ATPase [Nocardioides sp. BGMRC 2183]